MPVYTPTIELGNADTTISRVSAGVIAVEGKSIYKEGDDATTSNKGVTVYAGTTKALAGTDTASAMTPADTKAVVDARGPMTNLLTNSQWMACNGSTLENVGSQLIASWANSDYDTFTSTDADITSAVYSTAGTQNADTANIPITSGKLYKIVATLTLNSGAAPILTGTGGVTTTTLSAGANTITFEATAAATVLTMTNAAASNYSCTFTLYEVTPGYVVADAIAPDGWSKQNQINIWREHKGTNTKDGAFYALKVISDDASGRGFWWPENARQMEVDHLSRFVGRTVTIGAWVLTSAANNTRVEIYDSVNDSRYSSYHSGSGSYEWLELSVTIAAASTHTFFGFRLKTTDAVYISQPILVYGSSIGSGNYAPKPSERILCDANIALTGYTATTSAADGIINLEAASSGMIGKGVKAVLVKAYGKDSAAGDGVGFDVQSVSGVEDGISIDTQVNNIKIHGQGWVKTDSNGDIYFDHRGSGASALTVDIKVIGIET